MRYLSDMMHAELLRLETVKPLAVATPVAIPLTWRGRVRVRPGANLIKGYTYGVLYIEHSGEQIAIYTVHNTKLDVNLSAKKNPWEPAFLISGPGLPVRRADHMTVGDIEIPIP